jgi:cold-inducible RNA-binding protein
MNRKLYVGNLAFSTEEQTLQTLFNEVAPVDSVRLMRDRDTGRSRGFAFVEMQTEEGARLAIERFNDADVDGRRLKVNEARPMEAGAGRSFGAGGYGNGGGRRREPRW